MSRVVASLAVALLLMALDARADATPLPQYDARPVEAGVLRIWGPPQMEAVTRYWAEDFSRFHPGVRIETTLKGSDTAIPGLYSGVADIALMGRANTITDDNGFGRVKQYPFLRVEVMTGSLAVPGKSDALAVFVHRDNPLRAISLDQLDAVFGHEHRRGLTNIRRWGELGVGGERAGRPIRLYGYDAATGTGVFFQRAVLGNSRKMNWGALREFRDRRALDGGLIEAAAQSLAALRDDPDGLAVSSHKYADDHVRVVAVSTGNGETAVLPTRDNLVGRRYPLTRVAYAFVDRPPGGRLDHKVEAFLRYVLSEQGQAAVARDRGYLPLSATAASAARRAIDGSNATAGASP